MIIDCAALVIFIDRIDVKKIACCTLLKGGRGGHDQILDVRYFVLNKRSNYGKIRLSTWVPLNDASRQRDFLRHGPAYHGDQVSEVKLSKLFQTIHFALQFIYNSNCPLVATQ